MSTDSILTIVTIFLISVVEAIEMATIVVAVGLTRGWFPTLVGGGAGLVVLAVAVLLFGSLLGNLPLNVLRAVIGILLLLFGLQWLRKSIYSVSQSGFWSGQEKEEEDEKQGVGSERSIQGLDWQAVLRGFQGVFLEGLEIAFVVVTFGSTAGNIGLASVAAGVALIIVAGVALLARNLITAIPNNTLKFVVGILLTTYGTYWASVGLGAKFPGGDWGVLGVLAIYIVFSVGAVFAVRKLGQPAGQGG